MCLEINARKHKWIKTHGYTFKQCLITLKDSYGDDIGDRTKRTSHVTYKEACARLRVHIYHKFNTKMLV